MSSQTYKQLMLKKYCVDVYNNAVKHGWHEEDRPIGEVLALIHSEVSEALEEFRSGNQMVYFKEGKPEGIAIELVDAVIRIYDMFGCYGHEPKYDTVSEYIECYETDNVSEYRECCEAGTNQAFTVFVCDLHKTISDAYSNDTIGGTLETLDKVVEMIFNWLKKSCIDIEYCLVRKNEFNKTRPYKHGKKC